ncbi:uncharacterized protein SCHCODRAFT_02616969 [Schizophyllum commune H4-8]|uniref:Uncharacterized protein n=1 Tax=Schizophyllum commune (strain H4-8 / FGSC 9210) TaxID=578458 RepID=D8PY98_SCHCM|nr:uncharacterized protein SCHCODRAFT_02616969 [Schizophyllum commune H4-8]KAI5897237.1 hypothetical protein SCHCODRAFT_02616969 [Schizophyllum commune H4-8]
METYRTNDPSSTTRADANHLRELDEGLEAEESTLLSIFNQLDYALLRITQQRQLNRALLAPVRRLPREILSEIFLFAATFSSRIDSPSVFPVHRKYPFAAVCRMWRSVALSTPDLWTDIRLTRNEKPGSLKLLERDLRLTKARPLHVQLVQGAGEYWDATPRACYDLVLAQQHRWRSLRLEKPREAVPPRASAPANMELLSLEMLRAEIDMMDIYLVEQSIHDTGTVQLFRTLGVAPRLRSVELSFSGHLPHEIGLLLPDSWRLSHLALAFHLVIGDEDPCILFLPLVQQAAPTLEELRLVVDYAVPVEEQGLFDLPDDLVPSEAPNLRRIAATGPACTLLGAINAPRLSSLRLERIVDMPIVGDEWMDAHLTTLVRGAAPASSLELVDIAWTADSLLATLRTLPNIASLRIEETTAELAGACITEALLAGLTRGGVAVDGALTPPNPLCPLPNLRTLHLGPCQRPPEDEVSLTAAMRRMEVARGLGGSADGVDFLPLEEFTYEYHCPTFDTPPSRRIAL